MKIFKFKKRLVNTSVGILAGLDIGTSKVSCAIAKQGEEGKLKVLGVGHQASRGLKNGAIVDMEALSNAVAAAVTQAEEQAEETLQELYVSLSSSITTPFTIGVEATISGHSIDSADIRKMVTQACQSVEQPGETIIHAIPTAYEIDQAKGIRDPRGMFGDKLGADIYIVAAALSPLRNLVACVERCHLEVSGFVVSPYASGLATLVEDETDLGVTLLDMGAGTTSIAVFYDGKLHYTDFVPIGGAHVTSDIARGLSTPLVAAERLKTLYGCALIAPSDEREKIAVSQIGEDDPSKAYQITKAELVRIVRPRIEEIFEIVRDRLKSSPVAKLAGKRLVLTGGGSQLSGVLQLGNLILDKQGRLGRPVSFTGKEKALKSPSFATCAGLLSYAKAEQTRIVSNENSNASKKPKILEKFGSWVKENL